MESKEMTVKPSEQNMSERFEAMVMREFGTNIAPLEISDKMRQLIMGYFIGIDSALKVAEDARMRKSEQRRDPVPVTWANINLTDLAVDVMHYKKERLESYKPVSMLQLMKKVRESVEDCGPAPVIDIITDSVASRYQGITWDKLRQGGGSRTGTTNPFLDADEEGPDD